MSAYCLVLNASHEPIQILPVRRAFMLIFRGKAEMLEAGTGHLHSAERIHELPSVVKLKNYVKIPYKATAQLNRKAVFARDDNECQFKHCKRRSTTIDHVLPRSKGGAHSWENVVASCQPCNAMKGDKTMKEMGWELKTQPYAPTNTFFLVFRFEKNPSWSQYLQYAQ